MEKSFSAQFTVKERSENGGTILITTPDFDRVQDRVLPFGGILQNYLANPVVQWGHGYHQPWQTVGRATNLEVTQEGITAEFELRPPANEHDQQNIVRLLWAGGWVKTASIGFRVLEWVENDQGGYDFTKWELLEFSLVPIPMNPHALAKAFTGLALPDDERTPEVTPVEVKTDAVAATTEIETTTPLPTEPTFDIEDMVATALAAFIGSLKEVL